MSKWFKTVCVAALVGLASCATPVPSGDLVPAAQVRVLEGVPLALASVSGGMETHSWDVGRISDAAFRQALTETLTQAGARLSGAVAGERGYALSAELVSQSVVGNFDNTITLMVHYDLRDASGRRIWSENTVTERELSARDVFAGQERMRRLQSSAVQANLAELVQKLSKAVAARP